MKAILCLFALFVAAAYAQTSCDPTAVVFNVDGSSSISDSNFNIVRQFLLDFSNLYDYSQSQIGLVQFSSSVQVEQGMTFTKSSFDNAVEKMVQLKASTKTGAGIDTSTSLLENLDNKYDRIIITVTDGFAKDDTTGPTNNAENNDITLVAVGLGDLITPAGLDDIASEPFASNVYLFTSFSDALTAVNTIYTQSVCKNTPPPPPPSGTCKIAVAFNVDGSSSISANNFDIVQQFLVDFGNSLNFPDSQAAIVQFSSTVQVETGFTSSKDTFNNAANNMVQLAASTRTGAGISQCTSLLDGVDNSYTKYIITVTDGAAKDDVSGPVDEAENQGITLFAIGLGDLVTESGLEQIASQPFVTYVYLFTQFSDALQAVDTILNIMCDTATPPPATPPPAPAGECDKLAVAFNVDGSSSISPSNFDIVRQFLTEFGDNLNFPTSQAAIVQFSSSVVVETDFTFDRDTFNNAANNMVQLSASTRTGAGITQCTDLLSSVDNSYTKYIVTLTDGAAKDEVSGPVSTAEGENITLFAIGLGDLVTQSGLDDLASQPFSTYVYLFTDFSDSLQVVDTILSIMSTCATPAPEPPAPAPQPVSPPPSYTLAPIEPPTVAPGTVVVSINTIVEGSGSYETIVFGSASSIVYSLLLVVVLAFAAMF